MLFFLKMNTYGFIKNKFLSRAFEGNLKLCSRTLTSLKKYFTFGFPSIRHPTNDFNINNNVIYHCKQFINTT